MTEEKTDYSILKACLVVFFIIGVIWYFRTPSYQQNNLTEKYEKTNTSECTQNCSGHNAGYNWASDNDITDSGDCEGRSDSFIQGCIEYTER